MHELSIARALLQLVEQHRPPGSIVESLRVQVGPLQAIIPEAMQLAWKAATMDTELSGAKLQLSMLPWRLRCLECNRRWDADTLDATCECGSSRGVPIGGDELKLDCFEIVEPGSQDELQTVGDD